MSMKNDILSILSDGEEKTSLELAAILKKKIKM